MQNDKKQTALHTSISQLKKQKEILKNHFEEGKWNDDRCNEIDNCIAILESNLELEKQQMINFAIWFNNTNNEYLSYENIVDKYYKETYEQQETK